MAGDAIQNVPETMADGGNGRTLRAVIIDDNEVDRMRLRKLCLQAGLMLQITEAGTLAEFRRALDGETFDLAFIDYHLGMETGLTALSMLTAHPDQSDVLAIMVTSFNRCDVAVAAMREGCADYLVKEELSVEALRRAVTGAMERRILLGALSEARVFRSNMRRTVDRFRRSCGPEMRAILAGLLRQIRVVRRREDLDGDLRSRLTLVERGTQDVFVFLDDLATLLEDMSGELSGTVPRGGRNS